MSPTTPPSLSPVRVIFLKELMELLRDRRAVFFSFVLGGTTSGGFFRWSGGTTTPVAFFHWSTSVPIHRSSHNLTMRTMPRAAGNNISSGKKKARSATTAVLLTWPW